MQTDTTPATPHERLTSLIAKTRQEYKHFLGFPGALDFDYTELAPMLQLLLNNVGDPTIQTWCTLSSKEFEHEVLQFFAKAFRIAEGKWWGYVSNGSTESNLFALYVARQKFPDAPVFYSTAAHYSIPKNIKLLRQVGIPVAAQENDEMDYSALRTALRKHHPKQAIVVATVGTTMTEARDNVRTIRDCLESEGVTAAHIHTDGALAAGYLPFTKQQHPFDFADGSDSICVSGHKFIGSPIPCGVILIRKEDEAFLKASGNYTGSVDNTISGSRNGHTPLFLWYALQRWGAEGFAARAKQSLQTATYALEQLQAIGWQSWRNPDTLTVMIAKPPQDLLVKWQLATHGDWSHIVCMPGVSKAKIDDFVADLAASTRNI